jgi:hypothetical protein
VRLALAFALAIDLATPAVAQVAVYPRDESCVPYLTVQARACQVSTYFRCEIAGRDVVRIETTDGEGFELSALYSRTYDVIAAADIDEFVVMNAVPETQVPASLPAALAGETQAYKQDLMMQLYGIMKRVSDQGTIRRLPQTARIDGVDFTLLEVNSITQMPEPMGPMKGRLVLYISTEFGFPIEGENWVEMAGSVVETHSVPVDLVLPNEPGFATRQPIHDCSALSGLFGLNSEAPA